MGSSSHTSSIQRLQPAWGPPRNSPWPVSVWAAGPTWGSLGQQLVSQPLVVNPQPSCGLAQGFSPSTAPSQGPADLGRGRGRPVSPGAPAPRAACRGKPRQESRVPESSPPASSAASARGRWFRGAQDRREDVWKVLGHCRWQSDLTLGLQSWEWGPEKAGSGLLGRDPGRGLRSPRCCWSSWACGCVWVSRSCQVWPRPFSGWPGQESCDICSERRGGRGFVLGAVMACGVVAGGAGSGPRMNSWWDTGSESRGPCPHLRCV